MRRRTALWLVAGAAGAVMLGRPGERVGDAARDLLPGPAFEFEPAPVEGFRVARLGPGSGVFDPLAGVAVAAPAMPELAAPAERVGSIRFEGGAAVAPLAVAFTDFRCPHCRTLEATLERMDVAFSRREWPVFGPASEAAARAALAAEAQDGRAAMTARLKRTSFAPNEAWLRAAAAEEGLDADKLLADMAGPAVAAALAETAALARQFGLRGTPTLFYGWTILEGAAPRGVLRDLMAFERRDRFSRG